MDMPTHAEVGRTYGIIDQSQAQAILTEAVAYAESRGWQVEPSPSSSDTSYRGTKELPPGRVGLGISLVPEDPLHDIDGPQVLSINLEYGSVRLDNTTTSTS
jgi:hypothetical protein